MSQRISVAASTLEVVTYVICMLYNLSLLVSSVIRVNLFSLLHLAFFLFNVAFPSHYNGYFRSDVLLLVKRERKKANAAVDPPEQEQRENGYGSVLNRTGSLRILTSPKRQTKHRLIPYQMRWAHWINQNFRVTPRLPIPVLSSAMCIVFWLMLLVAQFVTLEDHPILRDLGYVKFSEMPSAWQMGLTVLPEILCFPLGVLTFLMLNVSWQRHTKEKKAAAKKKKRAADGYETIPTSATGEVETASSAAVQDSTVLMEPQDEGEKEKEKMEDQSAVQHQIRLARMKSQRRTLHLRQRDSITGDLHRSIAGADALQLQFAGDSERPVSARFSSPHKRMSTRLDLKPEELFADRQMSLLEGLKTSRDLKRARRRASVRMSREFLQKQLPILEESSDMQHPDSSNLRADQCQNSSSLPHTETQAQTQTQIANQGSINTHNRDPHFNPDAISNPRPIVSSFRLALILLLCLTTGTIYPSLLAILFFLIYIAIMILFAWKIHMSAHFRLGIVVFVACHSCVALVAIGLSRLELLEALTTNEYTQIFGFMDMKVLNFDQWQGYAFVVSLFTVFIVCSCTANKWISEFKFYLMSNEDVIKMVDMRHYGGSRGKSSIVHVMKKELKRIMMTFKLLAKRASKGITQSLSIFTLFAMLVTAISFPSALGAVFLLMLYVGFLVPSHIFHKTLPLVLLCTIVISLSQYAFNLPNVFSFIENDIAIFVLNRVGLSYLKHFNSALFFLHGIVMFSAASTFRIRLRYNYENQFLEETHRTLQREEKPLLQEDGTGSDHSEHAEQESIVTDKLQTNISRQMSQDKFHADMISYMSGEDIFSTTGSHVRKTLYHYLSDAFSVLINMIHIFLSILIKYSYYLTLGIIYFATLTSNSSDVLHFINLVMFIFFFISPGLASKLWIILLLYTQGTILLLYGFNVYRPTIADDDVRYYLKLIGLISFQLSEYWSALSWNLLILAFSAVQYHLLTMSTFSGLFATEADTKNRYVLSLLQGMRILTKLVANAFQKLGPLVFFAAVLSFIVFHQTVTVINFVFLVSFFISAIVSTIFGRHGSKFMYPLWMVITVWSSSVLVALYAFQFDGVDKLVTDLLKKIPYNEDILRFDAAAIGLRVFKFKSLEMLPYAAFVLLSIFVLKSYQLLSVLLRRSRGGISSSDKALNDSLSLPMWLKDGISEAIMVAKRFCILHQPKLLLVSLFLAAYKNPSMLGLVFMIITCLLAPLPKLVTRLWFPIMAYTVLVITAIYVFQFPIFQEMNCGKGSDESETFCDWFHFVGLKSYHNILPPEKTGNGIVLYLIWECLLVFLVVTSQRTLMIWKHDLRMMDQYMPGVIFLEKQTEDHSDSEKSDDSNSGSQKIAAEESTTVALNSGVTDTQEDKGEEKGEEEGSKTNDSYTADEAKKLVRTKDRVVEYLLSLCMWYWSIFKDQCNHFYERNGFGMSLLALLLGSLASLQTFWGLLYLILFGICLFLGRRISRFWWLIIIGMELQLIVLFIFNIHPFPLLDYRRYLLDWEYANYVFKYLAITIDSKQDTGTIFLFLYAILFFMAMQARAFHNRQKRDKNMKKLLHSPTVLIKWQQKQSQRMHVNVSVDPDILPMKKDFTLYHKPRNFVYELKYLVYHLFPQVMLLALFFNSSANPSFIRVIGASISLLYLILGEWLSWQGNRPWTILGVYLYAAMLVQAIYQIPIVITRETYCGGIVECLPEKWQSLALRIIEFIGLYDMKTTPWWWGDVVVMALFWIQVQMVEGSQYLYYTNSLHRTRVERDKKLEGNIALRTAKFLKRFTLHFKTKEKQRSALTALTNFKQSQTRSDVEYDRKELITLYRKIHESSEMIDEQEVNDRFLSELRTLRLHPIIISRIDKRLREYLLTRRMRDISTKKIEESLLSLEDVDFDETDEFVDEDEDLEEGTEQDELQEENLLDMSDKEHEGSDIAGDSDNKTHSSEKDSQSQMVLAISPKDTTTSEEHLEASTNTSSRKIYFLVESIIRYSSMVIAFVTYYCDHFLINIAYDQDEHGYSAYLHREHNDKTKNSIERSAALLQLRLHRLLVTLKYAYRSHTDVLCYALFTLNMAWNPNIWNAIYTVTAFGVAAMQSPVPHKAYWLFMMYLTEALITLQYLLYLAQQLIGLGKKEFSLYTSWQLIGWTPGTLDIIAYPLILLALGHHRNVLKERGDWDQYIESMMADSTQVIGTEYDSAGEETDNDAFEDSYYDDQDDFETTSPVSPIGIRSPKLFQQQQQPLQRQRSSHQRHSTSISMMSELNLDGDDGASSFSEEAAAVKFGGEEEEFVLDYDEIEDDDSNWELEDGELDELDEDSMDSYDNFIYRVQRAVSNYYIKLFDARVKIGMDLYAVMVTIDILTLLVFFISYPSLTGRPTNDVTGALRSNELPGAFVIGMIVFFMLIVVDRAIYLFSSLKWKLIFQYFCIICYHALFLYMYDYTKRAFNDVGHWVLGLLFIMKSCYLFVSAVQIRKGYPASTRVTMFQRSTHYLIYYLYLAWRVIPFVFELKTLLDWTFTKTTLTFYQWIKVEDIAYQLYVRKSYIGYLKASKIHGVIGRKQPTTTKATSGFLIFVVIMSLIFFPLLFYSTYNPVFSYNYIQEIKTRVSVTGFETLYTGMFHFLRPNETVISYEDYFGNNREASKLFTEFDPEFGVQNVTLGPYSESYWTITEQSRKNLVSSLAHSPINITLHYDVDRIDGKTVNGEQVIPLNMKQRSRLREMIEKSHNPKSAQMSVHLPYAFSPFLVNKATGLQTVGMYNDEFSLKYKPNCTLSIIYANNTAEARLPYWGMKCMRIDIANPENTDSQDAGIYFDMQTRKIVQESSLVGFLSSFGIITFYSTFVLAVSRLLRSYVTGMVARIFYEDLEDPDLLYAFCQECYLARSAGDLELEHMLVEQMLEIYRDTHLLQAWTRKTVKKD